MEGLREQQDRQDGGITGQTDRQPQEGFIVSVSKDAVDVSYQSSLTLPGALPQLFGHSSLDTGIAHRRTLIRPAEIIRKIRGLEYISKMLKEGDGQ